MVKRLSFILIGFLAIYTIAVTLSVLFTVRQIYPYRALDEGWQVIVNDTDYGEMTLSRLEADGMQDLEEGDMLTLTKTLPQIGEVPFPTFLFKVKYSVIRIYVDDSEVYTYGVEAYENGRFVGTRQHFVSLPQFSDGKEMKISLLITSRHPFYHIDTPYYGNYDDLMQMYMHTHLFAMMSGLYLMVFGALFLVIALFFITGTPEMRVTVISSLLCLTIATYVLTKFDIQPLLYGNLEKTTIEYVSLYLIPEWLIIIIYITGNYISKRWFQLLGVSYSAVIFLAVAGGLSGLFPINRFKTLYIVAALIAVAAVFAESIHRFRKPLETTDQIQMIGVAVLNFFLTCEMLVYILERHSAEIGTMFNGIMLPAGGIFYSLALVMNFFIYVSRAYAKRLETASLRRMAYADILTGLPNRASYDREIRDLDATGASFCIISLDLNGLKETNDTMGHAEGDRLLKEFAAELSTVFDDVGFSARVGGDEFVVIIRGANSRQNDDDIAGRLELLETRLKRLDARRPDISHSVAYGYAFSDEKPEQTAHDVFLVADNRMYEMKRIQHCEGDAAIPQGGVERVVQEAPWDTAQSNKTRFPWNRG